MKWVLFFNDIRDGCVVVDGNSFIASVKLKFSAGCFVDCSDFSDDGWVLGFDVGKVELEFGEWESDGMVFKIALKSTLSGSWVDITKICSKSESSTEMREQGVL